MVMCLALSGTNQAAPDTTLFSFGIKFSLTLSLTELGKKESKFNPLR